jgi:hypothetical protein
MAERGGGHGKSRRVTIGAEQPGDRASCSARNGERPKHKQGPSLPRFVLCVSEDLAARPHLGAASGQDDVPFSLAGARVDGSARVMDRPHPDQITDALKNVGPMARLWRNSVMNSRSCSPRAKSRATGTGKPPRKRDGLSGHASLSRRDISAGPPKLALSRGNRPACGGHW